MVYVKGASPFGALGVRVALEPIVPWAESVVCSAGCSIPSFVDIAGVVAFKLPASRQAGQQDGNQVAVFGECSGLSSAKRSTMIDLASRQLVRDAGEHFFIF